MATDTAFAVALIAMLGARVPVELRIFLTAPAIVDDIGAIVVVALFYSGALTSATGAAAAAIVAGCCAAQPLGVYRVAALRAARRRALVLRPRRRAARHARGRAARALHPDAAAGQPARRWWRRPTRS